MPPRPPKPAALSISQLSTRDELGFDVVLKRSSRRRTLEIIIRRGEVHLMLPRFVSEREGMAFLRRKRSWILETLDKQRERAAEVVVKRYTEGECFDFLGQSCPLKLFTARRNTVELVNGSFWVGIVRRPGQQPAEVVQKVLWQWYRKQAKRILTDKTDALVRRIGRSYQGVRLRRTKTKWGHCTAEGVIQYNWQIMAAPESVIDYLVAHEVSHLVHLNHGPRFWRHVERLMPDYRAQRQWLRTRGHTLVF